MRSFSNMGCVVRVSDALHKYQASEMETQLAQCCQDTGMCTSAPHAVPLGCTISVDEFRLSDFA
jgi:hypothetical protein